MLIEEIFDPRNVFMQNYFFSIPKLCDNPPPHSRLFNLTAFPCGDGGWTPDLMNSIPSVVKLHGSIKLDEL